MHDGQNKTWCWFPLKLHTLKTFIYNSDFILTKYILLVFQIHTQSEHTKGHMSI